MTGVGECQARALSAESLSEDLLHPPSLVSQPPPLLQDAHVPVPKPVLMALYYFNLRTIEGLLKFHPPQRLLIICIISVRGLKICLSAQINPDILEHSSEKATIGKYAGRALAT